MKNIKMSMQVEDAPSPSTVGAPSTMGALRTPEGPATKTSAGNTSDDASNGVGDRSTNCGWLGTSIDDTSGGASDGAGDYSTDWLGTSAGVTSDGALDGAGDRHTGDTVFRGRTTGSWFLPPGPIATSAPRRPAPDRALARAI